MFVLALPAGHLADRFPRRLVFACSLLVGVAVGVGLAALSGAGDTSVVPYLALAVGAGITMALGTPAARAMPPTLVSAELLPSAMTLRSIATQMGMVVGPALGGLIYDSSVAVYLLAAGACLLAAGCVFAIKPQPAAEAIGGTRARRPQERARGAALRRAHADPARRDPARPARRAVRRRGRAAARVREHDPARRADRAGHPARRPGRRRAARRRGPHPPAAAAPRRAHAADGRRAVRREHDRLRPLALLPRCRCSRSASAASSTCSA